MPLSREKKEVYFERLEKLLTTYSKCFVVQVDNVGSQQLQITRKQMRGFAEIIMGKNTLIRKIINAFLEKNPDHGIKNLLPKVQGNVGFVFTNDDLGKVKKFILANRVPAPARVGSIAQCSVVIPAGPTGCDPGQTNFFQVLQIPTKIVKGQIEITNAVPLISEGAKVGSSEAAILSKLNIKPFSFGLAIDCVYDSGEIFPPTILDISKEIILGHFQVALRAVAATSFAIGAVNQATIPHSIAKAFQACVAVAVELDGFSFKEADSFKAFLADPSAFAGPATTASAAPAGGAAAAPAKVEKKEEVVDALEGGMDMFGGGGGGGDY